MYKSGLVIIVILVVGLCIFKRTQSHMHKSLIAVQSVEDVVQLFAHDAHSIERCTQEYIKDAQQQLDAIIAISDDKRTWHNTAYALDRLIGASDLTIFMNAVSFLEMVSTDEAIREAAHKAIIAIHQALVDIHMNPQLYAGFKAYAQGNARKEQLSSVQTYFIEEGIKSFERSGLNKPETVQQEIKALQKKIGELCIQFSQHIAADQSSVAVDPQELTGIDEAFIAALQKDNNKVLLGVDYPTYFKIQQQCSNPVIRKQLYYAFSNRAYPINEPLLQEIIAARDALAQLLGFESYAAYELADEMVKTVDHAESFLNSILDRAMIKEQQEFAQFTKELPEGVQLNADGTMNPWDAPYVQEQYKKKHYNIDQEKIAAYFPMEKTIAGLLSIYEQFLSLRLELIDLKGLWSDELQTLAVYDKETNALLGYLVMDLYPRPFKYSHACAGSIVPATYHQDKPTIEVSVVLANFPKATGNTPALLKLDDVRTFFHEFGHAIHNILGRQKCATMAGTHVKQDFVEMPSQMLEEWLWDKEMLNMISSHYATGESLPNTLIDTLIDIKNCAEGAAIQRQLSFGFLSLDCFKAGAHKDVASLVKQSHLKCRPHVAYTPDAHMYASFGHLTGYGARYYGYLWSKIFALDLFNEIKKQGLLNPVIGKRYRDLVIGKGGSQDPNILLKDFLGREPNSDAFFKDLGL